MMSFSIQEIQALCERCRVRINSGVSRRLMARLESEAPPTDTRHLTDTRTRVSTLLEYALAFEANEVLGEADGGTWISCVLWNVFPDLLLRDRDGAVVAGLEVKALHTAAEEKSANLSTPLSKIRSTNDFLVIMNWGWERDLIDGTSFHYPHVYFVEVFDCHLLARIRDYTWLKNQGTRVKGIDCSTPVISTPNNHERFKAEEGNLGKLMRIRLDVDLPEGFPERDRLLSEAARFKRFQERTIGLGMVAVFKEVCFALDAKNIKAEEVACYPTAPTNLGHGSFGKGRNISLWAGPRIEAFLGSEEGRDGDVILWLASKLQWKVCANRDGRWEKFAEGDKAENSVRQIIDAIPNPVTAP